MSASARSIPAFAKDFPRHPELDRLVDLFEQGNYAQLRKDARALLQRTADAPAERDAAAPPDRDADAPPDSTSPATSAKSKAPAKSPRAAAVSPAAAGEVALRAATRELLKRIEPDPLTLYLLAIAAGLLVILAGWYWTHPHETQPPRPPSSSVSTP